MRCAKCTSDNRDGRKFCAKCGVALAHQCPRCSASNEPGEDFCGECGAAFTAIAVARASLPQASPAIPNIRITPEQPGLAPAVDGERKTVTALFSDIKGSTELMEDLDPEEARAIIDPALRLMIDAAHRYDGYVVQSTGDGIFALFGAPKAHEDHPQRALYAALRMQEELKRYSTRLREAGNLPIEGRVGVNTGEVVVRSITTGAGQTEYTPIGHTANLASRMQALAPTGSIAISEQTRKFVEGYFQIKSLGPTRVKGVSEAVNVYEVVGLGPLRTRLQRAIGRGLTKFVGREREMDAIKHAAGQAKSGHGQIVAAMAEPGVGKSRLFYEFKVTSEAGWMVLESVSGSQGKASAYLPVIDLLHNYFDITATDDERKRREKVAGKIAILDRSQEDTLPFLFSLLGIVEGQDALAQMDGQIRKRRTLEAIKRIVLRESLIQPLMVIFEDLHWIDEQTQGFLNLLAESIGTARILLLVNYRPECSHQWNSKTYYTQLRLDPLGEESAEEMLSALLGADEDLIPLKRLIIERTEGTPFFMEEMVQSLFEDGVLQRNGTVRLARSINAVKVPATVQAILAARTDRLPPEEKELLQTLAVIGREFALSLVRRMIDGATDDNLNRMLADLQMAEFIYEQPTPGDTEYVFKHALTQEVAYNSLLIERRKLFHERAGLALESIFADQLDNHLDELARHYSHSANVAKAVEYLERAGRQLLQRSAYADAISSLGAAINLLQRLPDNPERMRRELPLQLAVGTSLVAVTGYAAPETERAYARALELCERIGDTPELSSALFGLRVVSLLRGEVRIAFEFSERLLQLAPSARDPTMPLLGQVALGNTSYWLGEFVSAREHLESAIALYDPERDRPRAFQYGGVDSLVSCLSYMAPTLWYLGYPDQALKRSNEALVLAQAMSHPFSLAFIGLFGGSLRLLRREAHAARETAEDMMSVSTEYGITDNFAWATTLRGCAVAQQGHHEKGIAQIEEGLAASRATGAALWRPYFLCLLAEAFREEGRLDDGLSAVTEVLAAADKYENRSNQAEAYRLKGELLLRKHESNTVEAQNCFERAIEIARKQSAKSLELRATTRLAKLLCDTSRRDEARVMLSKIYNWFTEGFDTPDLKDAKSFLDQLTD